MGETYGSPKTKTTTTKTYEKDKNVYIEIVLRFNAEIDIWLYCGAYGAVIWINSISRSKAIIW